MPASDTPPEPTFGAADRLLDELVELAPHERMAALERAPVTDAVRERARRLLAAWEDPPAALDVPVIANQARAVAPTIPSEVGPYRILGELGVGAMGVVYRAEQRQPRREVALKLLHRRVGTEAARVRFEREAHFLGQLQHPGIAQIYEYGTATVDGTPTAYLALELVDGVPLAEYAAQHTIDLRARARLLRELAGAVHHAHLRGVIHRDLKPNNVLVTREGAIKVIDFGVARASRPDAHDDDLASSTLAGQVIGTLAYMSPEQVEGDLERIDARTDVYSLGVLAYELFSGELPLNVDSTTLAQSARRIVEDEVRALGRVAPECAGDLEAIVGCALEKDPEHRYASAAHFASDLGRYLARRPVEARPPSTFYALQRWASRNRALVGALALAGLALISGAAGIGYLAISNARLAEREGEARELAERQVELADQRAAEIVRRTDPDRLERARRELDSLWPAIPAMVPAMDRWLEDLALPLSDNLERHEQALEELRAGALPYGEAERDDDREHHPYRGELERLQAALAENRLTLAGENPMVPALTERERQMQEAIIDGQVRRLAELEQLVLERWTWLFADPRIQDQHDNLAQLVEDLRRFVDPETGGIATLLARRARAQSLLARTIEDAEPAAEWELATAAIRESARYGGLELRPQPGLRPLREDPDSGLWEFWHVESGARPRAADDPGAPSAWRVERETGVVLVLVPGGRRLVGAQSEDPGAPHFDPNAPEIEGPVREVELAPYFLGKYELTQSQWARMGGGSPSNYDFTFTWFGAPPGANVLHANAHWNPVESVSWLDAREVLRRSALRLPTLVEWEVGARGGTPTPWWSGAEPDSIGAVEGDLPAGNLADALTRERGGPSFFETEPWNDEWIVHAPVGSFPANPFGLHDTIGNVLELCGDPELPNAGPGVVGVRGGSYDEGALRARVTYQGFVSEHEAVNKLGLRAARSLDGS